MRTFSCYDVHGGFPRRVLLDGDDGDDFLGVVSFPRGLDVLVRLRGRSRLAEKGGRGDGTEEGLRGLFFGIFGGQGHGEGRVRVLR